jgi:hypothetical protein
VSFRLPKSLTEGTSASPNVTSFRPVTASAFFCLLALLTNFETKEDKLLRRSRDFAEPPRRFGRYADLV